MAILRLQGRPMQQQGHRYTLWPPHRAKCAVSVDMSGFSDINTTREQVGFRRQRGERTVSDEELETFEVSEAPESEPAPKAKKGKRGGPVADRRHLCITIVDHNAIIEGTGEESYINMRIPVALAEAGLKMIPEGKLGKIEPELIVEMIEEGATGELISITEEKKTISIRVE